VSIDHFFDKPRQPSPALEYGAERAALLQRIADQQKTITTLQGRVDELVGQVSKGQAEAMQPRCPVCAARSAGKRSPQADLYRGVFGGDVHKRMTTAEIAAAVGKPQGTVACWLREHGYRSGVVRAGTVPGRRKSFVAYGITTEEPSNGR
jgi:hypothetical protein